MEMESPSTCESYVGKYLEDKTYVQTFIAWEIQKRKYKKFGCAIGRYVQFKVSTEGINVRRKRVCTIQGINIGYQCTRKEGYSDRYSD